MVLPTTIDYISPDSVDYSPPPQMVDAPHPDQTESVRQQLLQTPSSPLYPPPVPPHNNNRRQLRPLQMALASATELQGDQTRRQREGEDRDRVRAASIFPEVW